MLGITTRPTTAPPPASVVGQGRQARGPRRIARSLVGAAVALALFSPLVLVKPAAADKVSDKKAEAAQIAAEVDVLGRRLEILAEQLAASQIELEALQDEVVLAQQQLDETIERSGDVRQLVKDQAVQAYVTGGTSDLASLIDPNSEVDQAVQSTYVTSVTGQGIDELDMLRAVELEIQDRQAELDAKTEAAEAAHDSIEAQKSEADGLLARRKEVRDKINGELAQLVAEEQARREAEQARRVQNQITAKKPTAPQLPPPGTDAPAPHPGAAAAVAEAKAQVGDPYVYGAMGPDSFDCSGLTRYAWLAGGRTLPHNSGAQYSATAHISLDQIQPGDLVFFGSPIHHVGIYVGGGQMVHAPQSGDHVKYSSIFRSDLVGIGRVD